MPTCPDCKATFQMQPDEKAFLEKMTFTFGGIVVHLPEPTLCPDCRMLRRTCHRNERTFYRTKSAKSGEEIISLYAPEITSST